MNIVCFEDKAYYAIIEQVYEKLKSSMNSTAPKWISGIDAMQLLGIKSKTSLQALRDNGKIRYTQPAKKVILYDRDSIEEYLNAHAQNTF